MRGDGCISNRCLGKRALPADSEPLKINSTHGGLTRISASLSDHPGRSWSNYPGVCLPISCRRLTHMGCAQTPRCCRLWPPLCQQRPTRPVSSVEAHFLAPTVLFHHLLCLCGSLFFPACFRIRLWSSSVRR